MILASSLQFPTKSVEFCILLNALLLAGPVIAILRGMSLLSVTSEGG